MSAGSLSARQAWFLQTLFMAVLLGMLLLGTSRDPDQGEKDTWFARGPVEQAFRKQVAWLERFLFELDGLVLRAEPVRATAAEAARSPTIEAAIEGAVRADGAPPMASASVYQDIDADEVSVPFVLLASAAADGAPALERIPMDVLWRELEHADRTGGTTSLVWFSPDAGSGVRLNLVGTAMHEDTATQHARLRLIHVSAPFAPELALALQVRCGVADGKEQHELPWTWARRAADQGEKGVSALRPADTPRLRWAVDSDEARARAYLPEPSWWDAGGSRKLLMFLLGFVAVCVLQLVVARLKKTSAPSPDAASSPAAEEPSAPPSDR